MGIVFVAFLHFYQISGEFPSPTSIHSHELQVQFNYQLSYQPQPHKKMVHIYIYNVCMIENEFVEAKKVEAVWVISYSTHSD